MGFFGRLFGKGDTLPPTARAATGINRLQTVGRDKVSAGDTDDMMMLLAAVMDEVNTLGQISLRTLTISGYGDDPREVYEIPEVRAWCQKAHDQYSAIIASFLDPPSLRWYLASLFKIEVLGRDSTKGYFRHTADAEIREYARLAVVMTVVLFTKSKKASAAASAQFAGDMLKRISTAVGTDLSGVIDSLPG